MKAARQADPASTLRPLNSTRSKVLIVDLNNMATFPTLAVGLLLASLRNAGFDARLLSPLAHDVPAAERERPDTYADHLVRQLHHATSPPLRLLRDIGRATRGAAISRPHPRVLAATAQALADQPDVLLLSAYLQHYPTVVELGKLAKAAGIPMLIGGPMFNVRETADFWRTVPGLTAVVGAEVDVSLPQIVQSVCEGGDLLQFPGVVLPDGRFSGVAPPLRPLDAAPVPDFTDFPWDRYRVRIIPMMTGRGCQWNRCNFCSDVISANGRAFRTRSLESVLQEMREQSRRHQTSNFLFLDMKLNSNPALFRGLIENVQRNVRGAQWIGTVHVDQRADNGLSRADLRNAAAAGMRRVSFGLESGSQRMLDLMDKGSTVEANARFIRDAEAAGVSVRCTMFMGYPGETARDLELTADFLETHAPFLDRVRCNAFSIQAETPIAKALRETPERFPSVRVTRTSARDARTQYVNEGTENREYRRQKRRVLAAVYAINRKVVRSSARQFDGLM